MPIFLTSKTDKEQMVDLLRAAIQVFIFPRVFSITTRESVLNHLLRLRTGPDISAHAHFETDPSTGETKLNITLTPMTKPDAATNH